MKNTQKHALVGVLLASTAVLIGTCVDRSNAASREYICNEKLIAGADISSVDEKFLTEKNYEKAYASLADYSVVNGIEKMTSASVSTESKSRSLHSGIGVSDSIGNSAGASGTNSDKKSDENNKKKKSYNVCDDIDSYIDYSKFKDIGIANVDSYLNIRKSPGTDKEIVGKLPPNAGCKIISTKDGWSKIKSGDVSGYVKSEYLLTGKKAKSKIRKYGRLVIVVECDGLRVRKKNSTESKILTVISKGEQLDIIKSTKNWVYVEINNYKGYVAREYVSISYALKEAQKIELPADAANGVTNTSMSTRTSIVATASQYLGNRYVYGGNSLTNGIDCSGFTQQIFAKFGYSLPRTSRAQANVGTTISANEAKAGDLVFYGSSRGISHVAICIGGGRIIHASNARDGIKISNMYYTTPKKVVRIIQ